jgi:hypothetical protein
MFFMTDSVNAVLWVLLGAAPKFSIFFRMAFEGLLIGVLLAGPHVSKTSVRLAQLAVLVQCSALIGSLFFAIRCPYANVTESFYMVNKYIYTFLSFIFLSETYQRTAKEKRGSLFRVYEWLILLTCASETIGFLFNISVFLSYPGTSRFGFRGLLPGANAASFFWIIAVFYGLAVWFKERRRAILLYSVIGAFLVGTKALWGLVPLALCLTFLSIYKKYRLRIFTVSILLICILFLNMNTLLGKIDGDSSLNWIVEPVQILWNANEKGTLNFGDFDYAVKVLTSARFALDGESNSDRFYKNTEYWTPVNFLFGGSYIGTEMEVFDIPAQFGIVGTAMLLYGYWLMLKRIDSNIRWPFIVVSGILGSLGGHMLDNASSMMYLGLLCLYFDFSQRSKDVVKD